MSANILQTTFEPTFSTTHVNLAPQTTFYILVIE